MQELVWDGRSDLRAQTPSGVYWLVISRGSGEMVAKKRMVLLR
jgi:hypothetical protein